MKRETTVYGKQKTRQRSKKTPVGLPAKLSAGRFLALALIVIWNMTVYFGSRLAAGGLPHHNMELPVDRLIPFLPWTVSIYLSCYLFWIVSYLLAFGQNREEVFRFFTAELLAKTVCLACFLLLPTFNVRPPVTGCGVWQRLMAWLYRVDAADNLFPSIHCLVSWFCWIGVRRQRQLPGWYRRGSLLFALAVCLSTLTTKQHVFVDVPAGILLAEFCYQFTGKCGLSRRMARLYADHAPARLRSLFQDKKGGPPS